MRAPDASRSREARRYFRTVFVSDVHLGSRGCQAGLLLAFLESLDTETLVLVGDIVDLERLKRTTFWPPEHEAVLRAVLRKAREGTRVIYVPGNHDREIRDFCGTTLGRLEIRPHHVHETADGRRFLVLHGDQFDALVRCGPLLAVLGDLGHRALVRLNAWLNRLRARRGQPYWSLAAFVKAHSRAAADYVARYRAAATAEARRRGVDGVICGHIHQPEATEIDGVLYLNDGDWVEHCSALVEDPDGCITLVDWPRLAPERDAAAPVRSAQRAA